MSDPDVIIVGAGITGLTCAHRLNHLGFQTVVLESSDRVGGVIRSERIGGYLMEWGPNSLVPTGETFRVLDELKLGDDLLEANPRAPRYIVVNKQLKSVPLGPMTFRGVGRAAVEPFVRTKSPEDESVANFFRRRFGREVHDRLVAPFVTGIFAGDTEQLSIASVFPRMVEMEAQSGSILTAMLRKRSETNASPRKATVSSFADGMETLPARLAEGQKIEKNCSGVRIGRDLQARATVLAVPAFHASQIVAFQSPELAELLAGIEYAPIVVAATSISSDSLKAPLTGFGFLVPREERLTTLGTVFNSVLFPNRAPEGRHLLTSFLGGALRPEVFDWPEDRIWETVCSELKLILKSSIQPEPLALVRHRRAIPQYNIGHKRRVENLADELRRSPGLFVTGNFLHGVSVPACMEHGESTAAAVADLLQTPGALNPRYGTGR
jgi:oxygen-dependent protoporphyrinogen oxidase